MVAVLVCCLALLPGQFLYLSVILPSV
eukprot:COSAG02_NODE_14872_length_1227_cov_4.407801_1_plen_26_part_10